MNNNIQTGLEYELQLMEKVMVMASAYASGEQFISHTKGGILRIFLTTTFLELQLNK